MRGISIDIGTKNLAIYVEEFDREQLKKMKNLDEKKRYTFEGKPTSEFKKILDVVYKNGRSLLHEKVDIRANTHQKMFVKCTEYLNSRKGLFDTCDVVIIETQLKTNPMAQRVGQHCYSFFVFTYVMNMTIINFPATHKTRVLGMGKYPKGKKLSAYQKKTMRKKWSIKLAKEIASMRKDREMIKLMESGKTDDFSDTLIQFQAFKLRVFMDRVI